MSKIVIAQAAKLATALGIVGDGEELLQTLKATAFKGQVTDSQMAALLIVANQYGLSPWTKEIYAYPDKNNGIVPVVGVDGWARIVNSHPQFDGMDFDQDDEKCTCIIYRKDRTRPVRITEYMKECARGIGPWLSHPKRMLRHKAMIQCARIAFGYTGIFDQDEAERIFESTGYVNVNTTAQVEAIPEELLSAAREYAKKGKDAFTVDFWQPLEKSDRALLAPYLPELQKSAKEADDARTVDSGATS